MPKLKTHKGLSKKIRVKNSGTVTMGHPGSRHNTGKKSAKHNRKMRKQQTISKSDLKRLRNKMKGVK